MDRNKTLHPRNKHNKGYSFDLLIKASPSLKAFVSLNKFGNESINFSNPRAVKELNRALLKYHYGIKYWNFPDENLCPPIPGRVDYIHHLNDLINKDNAKVLDIGTGASCIYALLGVSEYNWKFVASDINKNALVSAQKIIDKNKLNKSVELRFQKNENHILKNIIRENDSFDAMMCNPPFFGSAKEAKGANSRKSRNLGNNTLRNFSGNNNELWYKGGEKAFLHTYLYESSLFQEVSTWFTSLVSKKDNVHTLEASANKLGATAFKVIPMEQGNKVTRIVAWKF